MKFGPRSLGIDLQLLVIECMEMDFYFSNCCISFEFATLYIFVAFFVEVQTSSLTSCIWTSLKRASCAQAGKRRPFRRDSGKWKDSGPPSPSVHASVARPQQAPSLVQPGAKQSHAMHQCDPMLKRKVAPYSMQSSKSNPSELRHRVAPSQSALPQQLLHPPPDLSQGSVTVAPISVSKS